MKKIFFYLFVFSFLFNVYQYVNANKIYEGKEKELDISHKRIDIIRDSLKSGEQRLMDANYFSVVQNEEAQDYFKDYDFEEVMGKVEAELMALNHQPNGNPLVPYAPIDGNKFILNKAKVINHRWIIADFYSGKLHGEVLIKYFFKADSPTEFNTIETVLYTSTTN
ncbi:hydrolase [Flavobacterium sp. JP2137]|uniref:hydrolase n=1 Tax=Flavobacterium sp. JP2137 TaxID=3414510 RepID=UPI003D2FEDE0